VTPWIKFSDLGAPTFAQTFYSTLPPAFVLGGRDCGKRPWEIMARTSKVAYAVASPLLRWLFIHPKVAVVRSFVCFGRVRHNTCDPDGMVICVLPDCGEYRHGRMATTRNRLEGRASKRLAHPSGKSW